MNLVKLFLVNSSNVQALLTYCFQLVSAGSQSGAFYIFIALSSVIVVVCIVAWFLLK